MNYHLILETEFRDNSIATPNLKLLAIKLIYSTHARIYFLINKL